MFQIRVLICLFIVIGFNSCKKDKLKDEKSIFTGEWEWILTSGYVNICSGDGHWVHYNPMINSVTHSLVFEEKGFIELRKNDVLDAKFRIVFEYFQESSDDDYQYDFYIALDNDSENIFRGSISADSLWLKGYPFEDVEGCFHYAHFIHKK